MAFFGYFLSGKKVTRRRQKKGNGKPSGGVEPRPYARLPKAHASYVRGDVGIAPYVPPTESVHVIHPGRQSRPPLQGPKKHPAGGKKNENHGQSPTPTPQKSAAAMPRRSLCNMFLLAEEVCQLAIQDQDHAQRGDVLDAELEEAVAAHSVAGLLALLLDHLRTDLPADHNGHQQRA